MPCGIPTRCHRFSFKRSDRAGPLDAVRFQVNYWPSYRRSFQERQMEEGYKKKEASQPLGRAGNKGFLLGLTLSTIGYVCQIN